MNIAEIVMGDQTFRTYVTDEEKSLLTYFQFTDIIYEHQLNSREQNIARLLVEKSVLRRRNRNNQTYFTRNKPDAE